MERDESAPAPLIRQSSSQEELPEPIPDEVHEQVARLAKALLQPLPAEEG